MASQAREDIWGSMLAGVRRDVASVARAIARFEPVAMVVRPHQARDAALACGKGVEIVPLVNDDLWMRDMGPVFLVDGHGGLAGLDMNFNGAVLIPRFGDRSADDAGRSLVAHLYPGREVVQLTIDSLAEGGGGMLIWDGLPSHRSRVMKDWITTQSSWLTVERLPGYAHDLNPIEMVWGNVKGVELANLCPDTIDEARTAAEAGLNRVGSSSQLCFAFLAHTAFLYDR